MKSARQGRASAQRMAQRVIEDMDGKAQRVQVNLSESPLDWLRSRRLVTARQYAAGDALRMDWERAGLGARVTMNWDSALAPSGGGRGAPAIAEPGVMARSARKRLDGALDAAGPGLRDVLWRVVCACEGLAAAEAALGWPTRAGKLVLCLALDRVADYYRIG